MLEPKEKYKELLMEKLDDEYSRFKESIVGGTEFPYEETADKDYNNDDYDNDDDNDGDSDEDIGNIAFRDDGDDLDDEVTDDYSDFEFDEVSDIDGDAGFSDVYDDDDGESILSERYNSENRYHLVTRAVIVFCMIITVYLSFSYLFTSTYDSGNGSISGVGELSKAGSSLQRQINHLYSELNSREQRHVKELDKNVKVVISQFEKNIKRILPKNLKNLQGQIEALNEKVNRVLSSDRRSVLTLDNISGWQDQLLEQLNSSLPTEVPVVVNNSSTMLIIPEMHKYISDVLHQIVLTSEPYLGNRTLGYDLNDYIKEVLTNELQYVNKEYFIQELNRHLQLNKHEILQEVMSKVEESNSKSSGKPVEQYSTIILKNMVRDIYNSNQYRWEDDLDFSTAAQGARLVKHLTSSTFNYKNGNVVTPLELLTDSSISRGSTYWQCNKPAGCSWTIRFNEAIYLTRLSYLHGRFTKNLHMMTSAPKLVSVYVKLANSNAPGMHNRLRETSKANGNKQVTFSQDSSYILVSTYKYDLMDKRIRQNFPLPAWFIQLKPLIKSISFVADENYGNKEYTSLRKFIVNGVTNADLSIIENNEYPIIKTFIPVFSEHITSAQIIHNHAAKVQDIPSFGQDELDI
ncbi:Spindle pole body assembly component MPS3 [Nakaseomyces bracarensis]|uniref:Spindle pole body assembly component MPS3 n=1 Tax=Nakaseomyces bracarensis TaxID=273131 RepID=A0ABR4NSN5_9SACH